MKNKKYDIYPDINPTAGLDNLSIAQDFLLKKIENRELRKFAGEFEIEELHLLLYRVAIGLRTPSYELILRLSNVIPIMWWFTEYNEKKDYKPLESSNKKIDIDVSYKDSIAYAEFLQRTMLEWEKIGIDYQFALRLNRGKIKALPFSRMLELQFKINPAKWFIFE